MGNGSAREVSSLIGKEISEEAVADRKNRLRTANILLITMKALANEVAKNLVLAGVGSLTIQDHQPVTDDDLGAHFFVSKQDVGKNVSQSDSLMPIRVYPC